MPVARKTIFLQSAIETFVLDYCWLLLLYIYYFWLLLMPSYKRKVPVMELCPCWSECWQWMKNGDIKGIKKAWGKKSMANYADEDLSFHECAVIMKGGKISMLLASLLMMVGGPQVKVTCTSCIYLRVKNKHSQNTQHDGTDLPASQHGKWSMEFAFMIVVDCCWLLLIVAL